MRKGRLPLEAIAMLLLGAAIVVAYSGGWRGEVFGIDISTRGAGRLVLFAVVVLAVRLAIARPWPGRGEFFDLGARITAGALLCAALLSWSVHLSPYVGGADSYGYVSAADRIRAGALIQREPLADLLPYANAVNAATPLGYVPTARAPQSNVPAYPLGLPALMAVAATVAGRSAPFAVAPLAGLLLVAVCCTFVYRHARDATLALMAGAAVALHPLVFAYAIQPMSDVPATAFFALALSILIRRDSEDVGSKQLPLREACAGAAASIAFLIRPALLPGAAALVLIPWLQQRDLRRTMTFVAVLGIGFAVQLWSQWYLYGHPLANGYGPAAELFSLAFLAGNARSYGYWLYALHGALWFMGVAFALMRIGTTGQRLAVAVPLLVAATPYAVYRTYDHWETLRFILPLLAASTVASVAGILWLFRRTGHRIGTWLALGVLLAFVAHWAQWLDREHVLDRAIAEERFARTGELVARVTRPNAVILASLHSGSVRYYAERDTIDWARIPKGEFESTIAALARSGRTPFLLLDGDEEREAFAILHGGVIDARGWLPSGQVRDVRLFEAPEGY